MRINEKKKNLNSTYTYNVYKCRSVIYLQQYLKKKTLSLVNVQRLLFIVHNS